MINDDRMFSEFSEFFTVGIADMKNSLNIIMNTMEDVILKSRLEQSDQSERLSSVQYESARLGGELNKLHSIYRLCCSDLQVNVEEEYVRETLEAQINNNYLLFETRGIEVEIECEEDVVWFFDQDLIGCVFNTIIISVARYARSKLLLSASIKDKMLFLEVSDDGEGYPEDMINAPSIFEGAHQAGDKIKNLGLYYAWKIASCHEHNGIRGSISLSNDSKFGGGRFALSLP
ncbi:MAG: histidine kinase [Alteromonadaceae bacterium]|nr:MAG: histidine kinase [Alteromonadaceae bacterium]